MYDTVAIIVSLGGLEILLWWLDHKEHKKQTEVLEEIAIALSLKEPNLEVELTSEPTKYIGANGQQEAAQAVGLPRA
jgi:hypothetical protein